MSEKPKVKSLWGDLSITKSIRTPYVILKEQASILTQSTNSLLVGVVKRENHISGRYPFSCTLQIKVPSLNNYLISILNVQYNLNGYPSQVFDLVTETMNDNREYHTEQQLSLALEKVLSSSKVKQIISGLLNEVRLAQEVEEVNGISI